MAMTPTEQEALLALLEHSHQQADAWLSALTIEITYETETGERKTVDIPLAGILQKAEVEME